MEENRSQKSPSEFLRKIIGNKVIVRLNSGIDYKGTLACLDGYMNIALENTEEYVNGILKNKYGDTFLRGNNDTRTINSYHKMRISLATFSLFVFHVKYARSGINNKYDNHKDIASISPPALGEFQAASQVLPAFNPSVYWENSACAPYDQSFISGTPVSYGNYFFIGLSPGNGPQEDMYEIAFGYNKYLTGIRKSLSAPFVASGQSLGIASQTYFSFYVFSERNGLFDVGIGKVGEQAGISIINYVDPNPLPWAQKWSGYGDGLYSWEDYLWQSFPVTEISTILETSYYTNTVLSPVTATTQTTATVDLTMPATSTQTIPSTLFSTMTSVLMQTTTPTEMSTNMNYITQTVLETVTIEDSVIVQTKTILKTECKDKCKGECGCRREHKHRHRYEECGCKNEHKHRHRCKEDECRHRGICEHKKRHKFHPVKYMKRFDDCLNNWKYNEMKPLHEKEVEIVADTDTKVEYI
ncbi:hypothetical protein BB559_004102 [Furculomyces boomerangus]|uniref:Sm domain-containing protein n=2 Tax=Harpellales TaxID=61421 RepID=A0A2T9YGL1_9FUNG|nr:hypothetical protein BB559_004102 [Furculomyces boomerangus]PVZ97450.1 hypothetical protein BB558_006601 [Smittium angustum]